MDLAELAHIGTDDKTTGLARTNDEAAGAALLELGQELIQLLQHLTRQRIG